MTRAAIARLETAADALYRDWQEAAPGTWPGELARARALIAQELAIRREQLRHEEEAKRDTAPERDAAGLDARPPAHGRGRAAG